MRFFLGTHKAVWLARTSVPLFVSHRTLRDRETMPRSVGTWALDSGGFSELSLHGRWETSPLVYIAAVYRYQEEIGNLEWAAPQDWMCEPHILAKTGLTVAEHQRLTVKNFLQLSFVGSPDGLPFIPVLQGWTLADYERCLEMYARAGIDLTGYPLVGVGSVCRRQASTEIEAIMAALESYGLKLHGFGVKRDGLALYGGRLTSADSMAWSFNARWEPPLPGCKHKHCNNCMKYALAWRARRLAAAN